MQANRMNALIMWNGIFRMLDYILYGNICPNVRHIPHSRSTAAPSLSWSRRRRRVGQRSPMPLVGYVRGLSNSFQNTSPTVTAQVNGREFASAILTCLTLRTKPERSLLEVAALIWHQSRQWGSSCEMFKWFGRHYVFMLCLNRIFYCMVCDWPWRARALRYLSRKELLVCYRNTFNNMDMITYV